MYEKTPRTSGESQECQLIHEVSSGLERDTLGRLNKNEASTGTSEHSDTIGVNRTNIHAARAPLILVNLLDILLYSITQNNNNKKLKKNNKFKVSTTT